MTRPKLAALAVMAAALVLAALSMYTLCVSVKGSAGTRPPACDAWCVASRMKIGIAVDWLRGWRSARLALRTYLEMRGHGESLPELFRRLGFSHVRIRLGEDVAFNESKLRLLHMIVWDFLKAGLIPVVAYDGGGLRRNPDNVTEQRLFVEWWARVAWALRDTPNYVVFDLLIESSGALRNRCSLLNRLYNETIRVIRGIDPHRVIAVTPCGTSSPFMLDRLHVPLDNWTIVEWHIYAGGPKGSSGTLYNATLIREAVEAALAWSRSHHVPVWMGAWRPVRIPKRGGQHYPDGAVKPLTPLPVAERFARLVVPLVCGHGIPLTLNSAHIYIDYVHHRVYPEYKPLIEEIIDLCKEAWRPSRP